jgi:hypothetical protein
VGASPKASNAAVNKLRVQILLAAEEPENIFNIDFSLTKSNRLDDRCSPATWQAKRHFKMLGQTIVETLIIE